MYELVWLSCVCFHPQGQHREPPTALPTAEELIAIRDTVVPALLDAGRDADLQALLDRLWHLCITELVPFDDIGLHSNRVVVALWIERLLTKIPPPLKATLEPSEIELTIDSDVFDETISTRSEEWLLTKGSQRYPECVELVLGRAVASRAMTKLKPYSVIQIKSDLTPDAISTFSVFLEKAAEVNTFERSGDLYLHELMRGKMSPPRQAALAWGETPLKRLPQQFGASTNAVVRPYIEKNAADQLSVTNWRTVDTTDIFVLIGTLLREQIDGLPLNILANDHILKSESKALAATPQLFTLAASIIPEIEAEYGVVYKRKLYTVHRTTPFAMLKIIFFYIETLIDVFESSERGEAARTLRQFHVAITDPESLTATNPFGKLVKR